MALELRFAVEHLLLRRNEMETRVFVAVACIALAPGFAFADWWKDESGHGRGGAPQWSRRGGEPPDWARGRGVWDGHLKHGGHPEFRQPFVQPSHCYSQFNQRSGPPYGRSVPYGWNAQRNWNGQWDRRNDQQDRWNDAREREREAYLKWEERARERQQKIHERDRESFQKWQEWQRERNRGRR